jgi:hypothetical protein
MKNAPQKGKLPTYTHEQIGTKKSLHIENNIDKK